VADADRGKTVDFDVIADHAVVAKGDFPRIGDAYRLADDHALADFGTEQAKQPPAPRVCWLGGPREQSRLHKLP